MLSSFEADEHVLTPIPLYLLLSKQENMRVYKNHAHKENENDRYNENGDLFFR